MDLHIAPNGLIRKACIRLAFHFYGFSVLRDGEQIVAIVPDKTLRCLLLMQEVTAIEQPLHAVNTLFGFSEISHQLVGVNVKFPVAIDIGIDGEHRAGEKLICILTVGFMYLYISTNGFVEKTLARFRLQSDGLSILFDGERIIPIIPDKTFRGLFLMEKVVAVKQLFHAVDTGFCLGEIAHQFVGISVKFPVAVGIGVDSEQSPS